MTNDAVVEGPKKKRGCGFWILVGLGVLVALAIIGSLLPEPTPEQKAAREAEKQQQIQADATEEKAKREAVRASAIKVTARELFRAYDANEAAAQQQYGDRLLEVTGIVDGVDLDFSDEPFVKLRTDNQFMSAQAQLVEADQPKSTELSKGQKVVLLCNDVSEIAGMPMLKDCSFAD